MYDRELQKLTIGQFRTRRCCHSFKSSCSARHVKIAIVVNGIWTTFSSPTAQSLTFGYLALNKHEVKDRSSLLLQSIIISEVMVSHGLQPKLACFKAWAGPPRWPSEWPRYCIPQCEKCITCTPMKNISGSAFYVPTPITLWRCNRYHAQSWYSDIVDFVA